MPTDLECVFFENANKTNQLSYILNHNANNFMLKAVEWQIFRETENTEKSENLSTKRRLNMEIPVNSIFATTTQKQTNNPRKLLSAEYSMI